VLKGFGDAAVLEVIARHDGDTFRAVCTGGLCAARLPEEVEARHHYAEEGAGADPHTTVASMDIREKERVCGRIFAAQPNFLSSVLAQRSLGVSMPTIDVLLNILIVLYLATEESGQVLAIMASRRPAAATGDRQCHRRRNRETPLFASIRHDTPPVTRDWRDLLLRPMAASG
jgi:hypothetical protein